MSNSLFTCPMKRHNGDGGVDNSLGYVIELEALSTIEGSQWSSYGDFSQPRIFIASKTISSAIILNVNFNYVGKEKMKPKRANLNKDAPVNWYRRGITATTKGVDISGQDAKHTSQNFVVCEIVLEILELWQYTSNSEL